jgi:hypothetical protein
MKLTADEITKTFKGLAIATARASELASEHGKEGLLSHLSRHQQDAVRQQLLEVKRDIETVLKVMTSPSKP